jgi:hypothetical protein
MSADEEKDVAVFVLSGGTLLWCNLPDFFFLLIMLMGVVLGARVGNTVLRGTSYSCLRVSLEARLVWG